MKLFQGIRVVELSLWVAHGVARSDGPSRHLEPSLREESEAVRQLSTAPVWHRWKIRYQMHGPFGAVQIMNLRVKAIPSEEQPLSCFQRRRRTATGEAA
jgi:hypothetical protein